MNSLTNFMRKKNELIDSQDIAKKFNANWNKAFNLLEALFLPFIPLPINDFFK